MSAAEPQDGPTEPTRERLLSAALSLFAQKGFEATSVGEIESAAGLQPRRGGLYRHFKSKEALLEAAISNHLDAVSKVSLELSGVHLLDVRSVAVIYGNWLLQDMDSQKQLTAILEREGERMTDLREQFRLGVEAGFQAVAGVMASWIKERGLDLDAEVLASVIASSIVNHRRAEWTMGKAPLELEDKRFIEGLSNLIAYIFRDDE